MKRKTFLLLVLMNGLFLDPFGVGAADYSQSPYDNGIKLMLNVDDAAVHADTAKGIIDLWKQHAVSSTSIIAYAPNFENTVETLRGLSIPVGIHLGLHHGSGVLPISEVSSLHAPEGSFWGTVEETLEHMDLAEVEAELDAQIRKVIDAGLNPVHLDSHMGLLFKNRELVALYVRLAKKHHLAAALPVGEMYDEAREELKAAGLKSSVSLSGVYALADGVEETLANRTEAYRLLLKTLKPGINYCFSHPVPDSVSMRQSFGDYQTRIDDYTLFMSPEWKEMLEEAGVELVSF